MSLIRFFIFSLGFVLATQAKTEELNPYLKIGSKIKLDQSDLEPMTLVPAGNRDQVTIPEFPSYTKVYARATFSGNLLDSLTSQPTDYAIRLGEKRLKNIISELKKNGIINEAIRVGKIFKIDPVHILGPIIGENTFNGSIDRTIQDSFAQMFADSDFTNMTERMNQYANHPEVKRCMESDIRNYWKWRCVLFYSNNSTNNSNGDLINQYYSITNRGVGTFGIGQVQPFLLWSYSDIVEEKLNYPIFAINDSRTPMKIIFNNKVMVAYIAAMIYTSIEIYKSVAHVDISQNPGLTTTLYNLGDEYKRAFYFNQIRQSNPNELPKVNYMGWYINYFESKIRSYIYQ